MLDLQTISDRIEIDDLITRYTRSVDTLDWERFNTVFTPDATIDYTASGGKKGTRDEVRDWLVDLAIEQRAQDGLVPFVVPDVLKYVEHPTEFPDPDTEQEMELESPFDLLGLYRGVSLDRKSVAHVPNDVDMIFLYRRPLLDYWCETGEDLGDLVRHLLIHEIGHHFGLSDEDMEAIEAAAG